MPANVVVDFSGRLRARPHRPRFDITFIAYTSPSHTPTAPRWRIICPFSKELPPAERARYMNWLNGVLGGILSRKSWPLSQCVYFGGITGPPAELYLGDN